MMQVGFSRRSLMGEWLKELLKKLVEWRPLLAFEVDELDQSH